MNELDLLTLFEQFITDNKRGKRVKPDGSRISQGTIENYGYTLKLLQQFSNEYLFRLRIRNVKYLNQRELSVERNYWKKFYKLFTNYLYTDRGLFDNYVGQTIKNLKVFMNYLSRERLITPGDFYKAFYVRKEVKPIFPLMPAELNFLINDKPFEESLSVRMKEVKDFFVFGCTVGLRFCDLVALRKSNIRADNGNIYLTVRSRKTKTETVIKLPLYAVSIIAKYKKRPKLLPHFNKVNLNKFIKSLLERAGLTSPIHVHREKRGMQIKFTSENTRRTRFCDVATTHTMRRTAITTLLSLGVPESMVRKISGHAPGSKEFDRYVLWAQVCQDREMEKAFERLQKLETFSNP